MPLISFPLSPPPAPPSPLPYNTSKLKYNAGKSATPPIILQN